ncbi:MAG: hypothetical protein ABIO39_01050 [Caulobacteraceae bacterium]
MKALIISLGAAAVLATALPASAQSWDHSSRQGASIEQRIDRGVRDGSLTRREATRLRDQLQKIHQLEWRYGRDGVSSREARDLDNRYAALNQKLRFERHDGDNRYGRNDRFAPGPYGR